MQDMHSDLSVASAIDAATLTADSTPAAIDLRGFDAAEIVLAIGAAILFFVGVIQERYPHTTIREMLDDNPFALRFILIYLGMVAVAVFGIYGSGYNAADFVYMQF